MQEKNICKTKINLISNFFFFQIQHLSVTINPEKDLVDILRDLLKKFFKKNVLLLYVAQKASGTSKNKKVFKNTDFWTRVEGKRYSIKNIF